MFDIAWVRFAVSGTLILLFGIANHIAAHGRRPRSHGATPAWVRPVIWISIGAYYLLIGPTGGALLGGLGNLAGIALSLVSMAMRSTRGVRYPELLSRSLFYLALPIAVGVPWGLLALSVPAIAISVICCARADRHLAQAPTHAALPRYRMVPHIW